MQGWPGLLLQGGAFGLLSFVIWWLLTRYVPSLTETFKSEMAAQRAAFEKEASAERATFEKEMAESRRIFEQRIGVADEKLRQKDQQMIDVLREGLRKSGGQG